LRFLGCLGEVQKRRDSGAVLADWFRIAMDQRYEKKETNEKLFVAGVPSGIDLQKVEEYFRQYGSFLFTLPTI